MQKEENTWVTSDKHNNNSFLNMFFLSVEEKLNNPSSF